MYFGVKNPKEELRLDDAFCIQYHMRQDDTTCAKHTDPSDITVNMCLEKKDVEGSQIMFYGVEQLSGFESVKDRGEGYKFMVECEEGYCTIHYGKHPHKTLSLLKGQRTNIVLTYCYRDREKSETLMRTCYCTDD